MRNVRRAAGWLCADDWVLGAGMLAVLLYYVCTPGPFQGKASGDGWFGFLYLKSIVAHGTIDMRFAAPDYLRFFGQQGPGHHMPNRCPIGPVATWMPFYLVAMIPEWIGRLFHLSSGRWAGQAPAQAFITGFGTLLPVLIGWRALYVFLRRQASVAAARLGALAAMFATPLLWYTTQQPFYQHGLAFAAIALFIERWEATRGETNIRRFVILGAIGGFALSVRLQEFVWALPLAGEVFTTTNRRRWLIGATAGAGTALLVFAPQMAAWIYYTGHLTPPQIEPLRWSEPFLMTTLFSTRAGLLPWTPVIYAAVIGLVWGLRPATRSLVLGLSLSFAVEAYIVSCAWVLAAGYSYGNRRLSDAALLWALGVALGWDAVRDRRWLRRATTGFVVFCICFNLFLTEMIRSRRTHSSSAFSKSMAFVLEQDAHAPPWLVRAAEWIGYPFSQPAGYAFALWHRVRPFAFETVVGMNLLERDGQWFTVLMDRVELSWSNRGYVANGLAWADPKAPATVTGPARLLFSMFGPEGFELTIAGTVGPGPIALRWNGQAVAVERVPAGFRAQVPQPVAHAGVNELELDAPVGSVIKTVIFKPTSPRWW